MHIYIFIRIREWKRHVKKKYYKDSFVSKYSHRKNKLIEYWNMRFISYIKIWYYYPYFSYWSFIHKRNPYYNQMATKSSATGRKTANKRGNHWLDFLFIKQNLCSNDHYWNYDFYIFRRFYNYMSTFNGREKRNDNLYVNRIFVRIFLGNFKKKYIVFKYLHHRQHSTIMDKWLMSIRNNLILFVY